MDIANYISSGIIEMYVMGLCTPQERHELEKLRLQHPLLNDAILSYEIKFEDNLVQNATPPGDDIDDRILKTLNTLQEPVSVISGSQFKTANRLWIKAMAAAAITLLALSVVYNIVYHQKVNTLEQSLKEKEKYSPLPISDYNILKQPTITPIAMYGVAPHGICRCTLFWDKKTGKIYMMIHHLPMSSQSNYQLWAIIEGKPISVGLINDKIRDRFIELENVPGQASAFIVTLEKPGGNSTPTIEETYLSGKI